MIVQKLLKQQESRALYSACSLVWAQRAGSRAMLEHAMVEQVAESSSALFGAYAFDGLHMGVRAVALLMAGISGVICCPWILYAWCNWPKQREAAFREQSSDLPAEGDVEQQALLSA